MTTVMVTQPVYFPPTWWVARALQADLVVLLDNAQFARRHRGPAGTGPTWQNTAEVLIPDGRHRLTIPTKSGRQTIRRTPFASDPATPASWAHKHLATLRMAYAGAPHYSDVEPMVRAILGQSGQFLGDVTVPASVSMIRAIGRPAGRGGPGIRVASSFHLPGDPAGSAWMVALATAVGADRYLVGATALANYLEVDLFETAGIELVPHRYEPEPYSHFNSDDFEPNLSVIDLLMNLSPDQAHSVLGGGWREPV